MLKQRRWKIVNFAGGGAVQPFPNFSAYAASKAGVVRLTENLAKEYQARNIQINAVSPGIIHTKLREDLLKAGVKKVGKEYFKNAVKIKKLGGDDPEKVADLVLFLSSPKNKLTGKLISAKWDHWQKFNSGKINKLNKTSEYTLRRIDGRNFEEIKT
jgi:3-oxoacyl-[acyl-carrier protein] reductase